MGAFGRAMFDQLRHPNRDVTFRMAIVGGAAINCPCRDFLNLRREERDLIRLCLNGGAHPRLLDIGCGIGRHSSYVHSCSPDAAVTVVETDRELREYTIKAIPDAVDYEQFGHIPAEARFDFVLLLGNGLGVFGSERATREGLRRIHGLLAERGSVLIESGNPFPGEGEFYAAQHQIAYGDLSDGPFTWGYATSS